MILVRLYNSFTLESFYETCLVFLTLLCLVLLLAERYVSGLEKESATKESADDRLESARPPNAGSALKTLARKYLVVYAIVMGMYAR